MPAQEIFLDEMIGGKRVQVVKTYDQQYAREAFGHMSDAAKAFLWASLKPEAVYEPANLPAAPGDEYDAFLLDEMLDDGREEWNTFSYFIVSEPSGEPIFVSPDWPTAEAFAKGTQAPEMPLRPSVRLDTSGPNF